MAEHIPSKAALKKLYQEEYFFGQEYSDYTADRPALEKNFSHRIKRLKKFLPQKPRIVEVGCAYGYFLNLVKNHASWHIGFDVSEEGVKFARDELGVNASNEDFLKARIPKAVDAVCMWDVIEHVPDPERFIEKCVGILSKGGVLALTTGDIGTLVPRLRQGKWRMIHPPTHIYYFDKNTMYKFLEKFGFKLVYYGYSSVYRNAGSVLNQLIVNARAKNKPSAHLNMALKIAQATRLDRVNIPLNLRDIMEVIAIKK